MSALSHDALYKAIFSNPAMVASLLEEFVPADLINGLDFGTLERCNGVYISDNLSERRNDIVWRLRWADTWCYIYLMLEFQSTPDYWMALRVLSYTALLWEDLIKREEVKAGTKLPPVFPIVLYNGARPWTAPQEITDLVNISYEALSAFQPGQRFCLLDEKHIPHEVIEAARGEASYVMKIERAENKEKILKIAVELDAGFQGRAFGSTYMTMLEWMDRRLAQLPSSPDAQDISKGSEERMLAELIAKYKQPYIEEGFMLGHAEGRAEGRVAGLAEGRVAGLAEGRVAGLEEGRVEGQSEGMRALIKSLLVARFGILPDQWEIALAKVQDKDALGKLGQAVYAVQSAEEFEKLLFQANPADDI